MCPGLFFDKSDLIGSLKVSSLLELINGEEP